MNFKISTAFVFACLSCCQLNGMFEKCLLQKQAALVRHEAKYKETLSLEGTNKSLLAITAKHELDSMVRNTNRNFNMCFSTHLANNSH